MRICSIEDCQKKHYGNSYCEMHNKRFRLYGDPSINHTRTRVACTITSCVRKAVGHGLCSTHYQRLRDSGDCNAHIPIQHRLGVTKEPEYIVWKNMIQRCGNENSNQFKNYGGRGVTVCDAWINDYLQFKKDMGDRPAKGYSLERVDNDKGYSKENCVWILNIYQSENKRNNHKYFYGGETLSIGKLAKKYNLKDSTLRSRLLDLGWSIEQAIETPIGDTR